MSFYVAVAQMASYLANRSS